MDIQLKRGMLDVCVLAAIKDEDSYRYQIIKDMKPFVILPMQAKHESRNLKKNGKNLNLYIVLLSERRMTMTKQEYLSAIRGKIRKMPADDINKFIDYYSEMIDDRMEDGLSEEEAVADMDAPDDVVDQILADMPLTKLVKEKIKPSHRLKAWEIILLILGSPIWAPLLLIVLVIAMAVVILALLLSFYVIVLSMAVAGIAGLLGVIPFFVTQNVPAALFMLGAAFAGIGLAILFIVAVKPVTIGIFKLYKASVNGIKRMFVKER